jgi:WD40 repeat protein
VVADNEGYLLACTDIPGKDGETLKLKAVFTAIKTGQGGVAAFSNLGDQLVVSTTSHKHVRSFSAFQGWGRVITPDDLSGLAETKPTRQWMDHAKRVQALSTLPGGDMLATCSLDGSVFIRAAAETSMKALGVRVSSVWTGGSSAVTIFRKDNKATVVACGGCDGSINILSTEPHHLKGKSISVAAQSTSQRLMDALGEHVDLHTDEPTFVEKQLMADREMENALNAAKKNAFRDSIRKQKVSLDELLQQNADAPEIERISRDQVREFLHI